MDNKKKYMIVALVVIILLFSGFIVFSNTLNEGEKPSTNNHNSVENESEDKEVEGVVDEPEVEEEETATEEKEVVEEEPVKQAEEVVVVKTVAEELGVTEADKTMYTTSALNVRKDATADSEKIGSYGKGSSVKVTGELSNGWVRVNYDSKEGFVSGGYLTGTKPVAKSTLKTTTPTKQESKDKKQSSNNTKPKSSSTQKPKSTEKPASTPKTGQSSKPKDPPKPAESPKPKDPPKSDSGGSWGTAVPRDEGYGFEVQD